jgi:CBS domain-containing protein
MKKISDVMNTNLITIDKETNLKEILKIMQEKGIGRLPVIENNMLIGVVTRDDILVKQEKAPVPITVAFWDLFITLPHSKHFQERLKKLTAYKAEEIMSTDYLLVEKESDLEEIVTKIVEEDYKYALIGNKSHLEGIITKTDLINKCF